MTGLERDIVELALSLGASLAGVARVADLRGSPSHRGGEGTWPAEARSALVLALEHREDEPELDWWGVEGGTPGNRRLIAIAEELERDLPTRFGIEARPLPYQPRLSLFLKDAAALAGLGLVGANNLLVTPRSGPHVRLRALFLNADLAPTGPLDWAPCDNCGRPCWKSCPRQAFESGAYIRERCQQQMEDDESNPVAGTDGESGAAVQLVKYCRACEMACVAGRT